MLKILSKSNILLVICFLTFGIFFSSCDKDDDVSSETQLFSYGPSPALRGGELKFIGVNLDKVTSVVLPNNIEVKTFKTKTASLLVIEVPQETVEGNVSLKTSNGNINAKSWLGISEPISIASVSPARVRPGDVVTIKGTYLNLIKEVVFANNKAVIQFESQNKEAIQVKVPEGAQTGPVVISNGANEPILVTSTSELQVILPTITTVSPNPVKAGSLLTIRGTDLDLTKEVAFGGNRKVTQFEVSAAKDQLTVTVPENAEDGKIKLIAASLVEVESADALTMVTPTITEVTPRPAKNSSNITIRGTNLDLVTSTIFGGEKAGTIVTKSATELIVRVPADATEGIVTLNTAAKKSVSTNAALTLVKPEISSMSPMEVKTLQNLTITGTNLDLVAKVKFTGGTEGTIVTKSATELVVTVPTRSQSGAVTLITTNGTEVVSTQSLSVQPGNVPTVTSMPASAKPGEMIVIEGLKLNLTTEVIFPGNIKATQFGTKTATRLEVVVPEKTEIGVGRITFITAEGDVTESPEIQIVGAIKAYIFDDALASQWQRWNGWGTASQDFANTEHVYRGSKAIKVSYNDAYGAIQLHPTTATILNNYTHIILYVRGGTADSRGALQVQAVGGKDQTDAPFNVKAGEYRMIEIPISSLGNVSGGINDLRIKNYGTNPNTFYIDDIGLR